MKLYIKEKVFSWGDHFYVRDAAGREKYEVRGEVFSLARSSMSITWRAGKWR